MKGSTFVSGIVVCNAGVNSTDDLYSVGKTMFVALIGVVELEIALISRYWTRIYTLFWALSFTLVRPRGGYRVSDIKAASDANQG